MQLVAIFLVVISLSFGKLVCSIPINTDFVSPEELEAIRNGQLMKNKVQTNIPTQNRIQKPINIQRPATIPSASLVQQQKPYSVNNDDRPIWGSTSISSANAQSQATNKHGGQEQTAGANSYNNEVNNEHGNFHNSGASSIGSNIAENGKKGQLSAANVQKTSSHTVDGFSEQETSQSQSANFDQHTNSLQASDANTKFKITKDKTGEKKEISSGSSATNQNAFGSGNSKANTNVVEYNQNGVKGTKTDSVAQAIQINKDGSTSNTHSHSGTNVYKAPDGTEVKESKAGSSSATHGQTGSSGSSTNCGTSGGTSSGNGFTSSFSSSSSSSFTNTNGQTFSQTGCDSGSKTATAPHGPLPIQFGPPVFQPFPIQYNPFFPNAAG
ncbi:CLUMA_CG003283, isoform B [Clunio marinus]|nr:CLUMA_CG003283, isoform B [Clunio marinus]